ncbi:MAG: Lpg1974 family pore-forming outer membrane protein [Legionellales bacterium]|jgi:hypothetical protein
MKTKNIYLSSLTSLAVMACAVASANENVYVPELEGGITASVGAWIATPSSTEIATIARSDEAVEALNVTPGYDVGIEASLGYIFEDTANGIEFFFRNFDTNDTSDFISDNAFTPSPGDTVLVNNNVGYELTAFDLMINQFMNIGQHMQMRFGAGASYVELEQNDNINFSSETTTAFAQQSSEYKGWGPRLAIDARYDFGDDIQGLGLVAGGSVAYFLGDLDSSSPQLVGTSEPSLETVNNDIDNQAVTNLRGNVGVDYVYFFDNDEGSTLGLEVGYQVDYYADAVTLTQDNRSNTITNTESATFSGPYVSLKGVF